VEVSVKWAALDQRVLQDQTASLDHREIREVLEIPALSDSREQMEHLGQQDHLETLAHRD